MALGLAIAAFAGVGLFVLGLLHSLGRLHRQPLYITLVLFLSWSIPFSIVVLLPIDLASANAVVLCEEGADCQLPTLFLARNIRLNLWKVSYWLTFGLTWVILPTLQSFSDSGHRTVSKRFKFALRTNLKYQLMVLGAASVLGIYILLSTKVRNMYAHWKLSILIGRQAFKALLIALANSYGLVASLILMGSGLVTIPRSIWYASFHERERRKLEDKAVILRSLREEAGADSKDVARQVAALHNHVKEDWAREWVDELVYSCPLAAQYQDTQTRRSTLPSWIPLSRDNQSKNVTADSLALLSRRIRITNAKTEQYTSQWNDLVSRYYFLQELANARVSNHGRLLLRGPARTRLPPRLAYLVHTYMTPFMLRGVAIVLSALSIAVVWSEILMNTGTQDRGLSVVGLVIANAVPRWPLVELLTVGWLMYMCACAYLSLMQLKVFDMYALIWRGHTDTTSLLFYGSYLCRLTIPLSYNFLLLLPPSFRRSAFNDFLGTNITLTPLGEFFVEWFPLFVILPIAMTMLRAGERLKQWLGLDQYELYSEQDPSDPLSSGAGNVEGRTLLKQAIEPYTSDGSIPHDQESLVSPFRDDRPEYSSNLLNIAGSRAPDDSSSLDESSPQDPFWARGRDKINEVWRAWRD